ncbi:MULTISPECIES: response regulator [unclassified Roseovarius]|uniref:response regulator n=1 Tax=unclassified Roseovarius TaxID=2614913 RepID=UPI00273DD1C0|nr:MULTISPECIES: response regulator [unclassified Roseovarius]
MDGTVLVADDDRTIRTVLTQALTRAGCKVHATSSLTTLMRWVSEGKGDVVISDVMMPDGNGLEMLPKIAEDRPGLPVIVISAQNTIMTAIKANEADAYDYLPKPFDLPDLMKRTARALDVSARTPKKRDAPDAPEELPLIGRTPAMQLLYRVVARVMNTDLPVLICGDSGTGKSLIARAIHDFSDRRTMPFVTVTPGDLVDLEGPTKLMARARGGTIVLEEIADLDAEAQGRVVRMMDAPGDGQPRFMATTQISGSAAMQAAGLREDLYYRLGGAVIDVPSMRDRVDDIPLLVSHFLGRSERDGMGARSMSDDALELMRSYVWPGNVRQLENAVRRIALTAQGEEITRAEVEAMLSTQPAAQPVLGQSDSESLSESVGRHLQRYFDLHGEMLPPAGLYARILREIEHPLIEISLDATGGNQAKCADLLGINRNTLRKKITELDIRVTRRRKLM